MKKALLVKNFTGLASALSGSDMTGWELDIIEDFGEPPNLSFPELEDLYAAILQKLNSVNYDLVLFEEPSLFKGFNAAKGEEVAKFRKKILVGSEDALRLEMDRAFAKSICEKYGIPSTKAFLEKIPEGSGAEVFDKLLKKYSKLGKIVIKRNKGQMFTMGSPVVSFNLLKTEYLKDPKSLDEITIEKFVSFKKPIEFSVCGLANGKEFTPICTLFDVENKMFAGGLGPKISDVSQIIKAGVSKRFVEATKNMSQWVRDVNYRGWLDIDCIYDVETDQFLCFEFMARFAIPSMAAVVKLHDTNWLEAFHTALVGKSIKRLNIGATAVANYSVEIGMFSFSTEFNCMTGDLPWGAEVNNFQPFYGYNPSVQHSHLVSIETYYKDGKLRLTGDYGRHFVAIGLGNTWRTAAYYAYDVCKEVSYPNKIYKNNLFGYISREYCDYDLDSVIGVIEEIF